MVRMSACTPGSVIQVAVLLLASVLGVPAVAAPDSSPPKAGEPVDTNARKTYAEAVAWLKKGDRAVALESFRKANKQDGGRCSECLRRAYTIAISIGAYKDAADVAHEWLPLAATDADKAVLHYRAALAIQQQGIVTKKDKWLNESCDEFKTALQLNPAFAAAHYSEGISLAYLHQDDAARAEFTAFLDHDKENAVAHQRAQRFLERIELARARMAPPFSITTLDGQNVTMDNLTGKVVLIDFWATWCGPCRNALPHIRQIAKKFEGQPLVVLSISLDKNSDKWKSFVQANEMTWLQYRDGDFNGQIAKLFAVNAIPATFSIDADGVLEDQHVGDADIEGKLKKMIARANEVKDRKPLVPASPPAVDGSN